MKKLLLFFQKPLIGGVLTFIGTLELIYNIPSKYFTYQIHIWIIILGVIAILLSSYLWKRIKIFYYIKTYTSDTFGDSYMYKWRWNKVAHPFNAYGYVPYYIEATPPSVVNPTIKSYDCVHHYINDANRLQRYIMMSLYDKVENTEQTHIIMQQLHTLEKQTYERYDKLQK